MRMPSHWNRVQCHPNRIAMRHIRIENVDFHSNHQMDNTGLPSSDVCRNNNSPYTRINSIEPIKSPIIGWQNESMSFKFKFNRISAIHRAPIKNRNLIKYHKTFNECASRQRMQIVCADEMWNEAARGS